MPRNTIDNIWRAARKVLGGNDKDRAYEPPISTLSRAIVDDGNQVLLSAKTLGYDINRVAGIDQSISAGVQSGLDALQATDMLVTPAAMSSLRAELEEGKLSCSYQVQGDSTGTSPSNWPNIFLSLLAAKYLGYTVRYVSYDGATNLFSAPALVQTGTNGTGQRRFVIPSTANQYSLNLPASYMALPSGAFDVRMRMSFQAWPGSEMSLFGKNNWPKVSFTLAFTNDRKLRLNIGTTGVNDWVFTSSTATTFNLDDVVWLRATFVPGATSTITFYTSTWSGINSTGATWTQLGTAQTTANNLTLFNDPASQWWVGGNGLNPINTTIYAVELLDGVNGPNIAPVFIDQWAHTSVGDSTTGEFYGVPEFWLINTSVSGWGFSDWNSKSPKLIYPKANQRLYIINTGHNDSSYGIYDLITTNVTNMRSMLGEFPRVILSTQNPRIGTSGIFSVAQNEHMRYRYNAMSWAPGKGWGVVDSYGAMLRSGIPLSTMIGDIHPNLTGQTFIANLWMSAFDKGRP